MLTKSYRFLLNWRREGRDARAAVELARLGLPYVPWSQSAVTPSALHAILNDIEINGRQTVIEFGSGISTLYIARVLRQTGGHLISVESQADWASIVSGWLEAAGVAESVTQVLAPLGPCPMAKNALEWYDHTVIEAAIEGFSIDCVFVDGPLAYKKSLALARYPALPVLANRLSDRYAIFLDDAARAGEQQVATLWDKELGIRVTLDKLTGLGIAVGGPHFHAMP